MKLSFYGFSLQLILLNVLLAGGAIGQKNQSVKEVFIDLQLKNASIIKAFNTIESKTNYRFNYNKPELDKRIQVNLNSQNSSVADVLMSISKQTGLKFRQVNESINVDKLLDTNDFGVEVIYARDVEISGKITDENGDGLPGASVLIKGTTTGTTTDLDGNYRLSVPEQSTVVVSFVGYKTSEILVITQTVIDVQMQLDAEQLEEVVVVGYGEQKKVNVTGSVDNISGKKLSSLQVNTMGEALQGQLPGVYIGIADGKPGRQASFNIRGTTSINGGEPLVVIDGVRQSQRDLNNLSPYDIEEISILKDAASTAIYGARASFGVILITTKKGSKGLNVQYNSYFGFSKATIVPEIYDNPLDYISINENEFNANIGHTYFTDAQIAYPDQVASGSSLPFAQVQEIGGRSNLLLGGRVYNYYEEWFRKFSPKENHRISLNGSNGKFSYYLAGDFNFEKGALKFKPEKVKRYTLRSNISYKFNEHFSIFNNTQIVKRDEELPNLYLYGFTSNVWRFIENSNAMMPEYVEVDGEMIPTDLGFYREFVEKQSNIQQDNHDIKSTIGIDLAFLKKKLNVHLDLTYQFRNNEYLRWWDNTGPYLSNSFNNRNIVLDYYSDAGPARVIRTNGRDVIGNINAYATYNLKLGKNNFTFLGGFNQESIDYLYFNANRENPLPVPQKSLNLASGTANVTDDDDSNASRSTFARINYNWSEKYLLELNGSYFLSSKFTKRNRGHLFLAASGAWRLSEEQFFEGIREVVNNFKVRGSYGSIGNADIGSFDYIPIFDINLSSFTLDGSRVNYTSVPPPRSANFTWETVQTINFGVDFSFLKNRLKGSLDIYQRDTKNMLANFRSLPSVFGASVPKENIASLRNNGWELNLGWMDEINLTGDTFNYGIQLNLSDYKAVITDYYNPTSYLGDYYEGKVIGEIWGLNTLGYFETDAEAQSGALLSTSPFKAYAAAGTIKFEDVNEDGVISRGDNTLDNPGDYRIIGNSTPRYQYGITLNSGWKGFDFNAFFRGVGKQDFYPTSESVNFWGPYNRKYQVMIKHAVENRWTPENPNAYFPRPQGYIALPGYDLGEAQTKYLQNASFIRLKSLTLGYSLFPFKNSSAKVRVYLTGQNLWEATKLHSSLDPEGLTKDPDAQESRVGTGTAYPIQRVYAFGVQVQF